MRHDEGCRIEIEPPWGVTPGEVADSYEIRLVRSYRFVSIRYPVTEAALKAVIREGLDRHSKAFNQAMLGQ